MMNCADSGTDGYNSIPVRDRLRRAFYTYLINQEAYFFTLVFAPVKKATSMVIVAIKTSVY